MTIFSCKDCPDRTFDCHVKCKKYIEAKKKHEQIKKDIRLHDELDQYIIEARKKTKSKQLRKYGRSLIKTKE